MIGNYPQADSSIPELDLTGGKLSPIHDHAGLARYAFCCLMSLSDLPPALYLLGRAQSGNALSRFDPVRADVRIGSSRGERGGGGMENEERKKTTIKETQTYK